MKDEEYINEYNMIDSFLRNKIANVEKETTRIDLDLRVICKRDKDNMLGFYVVPPTYKGITHRVKFTIEKEKKE